MSKLERLQLDSSNLQNFVEQLTEEGNQSLAQKILAKKQFLDERIEKLFSCTAN
jgi:phage shock protein A